MTSKEGQVNSKNAYFEKVDARWRQLLNESVTKGFDTDDGAHSYFVQATGSFDVCKLTSV